MSLIFFFNFEQLLTKLQELLGDIYLPHPVVCWRQQCRKNNMDTKPNHLCHFQTEPKFHTNLSTSFSVILVKEKLAYTKTYYKIDQ